MRRGAPVEALYPPSRVTTSKPCRASSLAEAPTQISVCCGLLGPPDLRAENQGTNFFQDVCFSRLEPSQPKKGGEKGHQAGGPSLCILLGMRVAFEVAMFHQGLKGSQKENHILFRVPYFDTYTYDDSYLGFADWHRFWVEAVCLSREYCIMCLNLRSFTTSTGQIR